MCYAYGKIIDFDIGRLTIKLNMGALIVCGKYFFSW